MSDTYKKKYYGGKSVSKGCRSNGSCDYCRRNRLNKYKKAEQAAEYGRREFFKPTDQEENSG